MRESWPIYAFFGSLGLFAGLIAYHHLGAVARPAVASPQVVAETVVAKKGDREDVRPPPDDDFVKTVRVIAVAPLWRPATENPRFEPLPAPVIAQTEFPSLPKPEVTKPAPKGDICARHGMKRKDEGRRWRCVK